MPTKAQEKKVADPSAPAKTPAEAPKKKASDKKLIQARISNDCIHCILVE